MTKINLTPKEALRKLSPRMFGFIKKHKTQMEEKMLSVAPSSIVELSRKMEGIGPFHFPDSQEILQDLALNYSYSGDLGEIFTSNRGAVVHKWHHYIPIYEQYFSKFRDKELRFLEIGVSRGGSLQMWRKYFGSRATIFGIDIDQECLEFNGVHGQVRIGSQIDENFLRHVISEMGGVDVVLDDGSHDMEHIEKTLKILFPLLSEGGVYLIEDLHTAYWRSFHGGYGAKRNFVRTISKLMNDMHSWYHPFKRNLPEVSNGLTGIHIYDSIVVLEKGKAVRPRHSQVS